MGRRKVVDVTVQDVEKRRKPSKHYVYIIVVTWTDGTVSMIYRRYSKFFELQNILLNKYHEEAGYHDPTQRTIPFLPGKILIGQSHILKVAQKRLQPISSYCKTLVALPAKVCESDEVLDFFEPWPEDFLPDGGETPGILSGWRHKLSDSKIHKISGPLLLEQYTAVAAYLKVASNEVNLTEGQHVEVIEKNQTGWWFVSVEESQGWVPSAYLEKRDGSADNRIVSTSLPGEGEKYLCQQAYVAHNSDEVSLDKGGVVEVMQRNLDGWWLVRYKRQKGLAPATNLVKVDTLKAMRVLNHGSARIPVEMITDLSSVSDLLTPERNQAAKIAPTPDLVPTLHSQSKKRLFEKHDSVNVSNGQASGYSQVRKQEQEGQFEKNEGENVGTAVSDNSRSGIAQWRNNPSSLSSFSNREQMGMSIYSSSRKIPPPRRESFFQVKKKPPRPAPPKVKQGHVTIASFSSSTPEAISFEEGVEVEVLEKSNTGWWFVKIGYQEGWAPTSYLQTASTVPDEASSEQAPVRSVQSVAGKVKLDHFVLGSVKSTQSVVGSVKPAQSVIGPVKSTYSAKGPAKSTDSAKGHVKSVETNSGRATKPALPASKPKSGFGLDVGKAGSYKPVTHSDKGRIGLKVPDLNEQLSKSSFNPNTSGRLTQNTDASKQSLGSKHEDGGSISSPMSQYVNSMNKEFPPDDSVYQDIVVCTRPSESSPEEPIYENPDILRDIPFEALNMFIAESIGELGLLAGERVLMIDKNRSGWCFARSEESGQEGWVPLSYLRPIAGGQERGSYTELIEVEQPTATSSSLSSHPNISRSSASKPILSAKPQVPSNRFKKMISVPSLSDKPAKSVKPVVPKKNSNIAKMAEMFEE